MSKGWEGSIGYRMDIGILDRMEGQRNFLRSSLSPVCCRLFAIISAKGREEITDKEDKKASIISKKRKPSVDFHFGCTSVMGVFLILIGWKISFSKRNVTTLCHFYIFRYRHFFFPSVFDDRCLKYISIFYLVGFIW